MVASARLISIDERLAHLAAADAFSGVVRVEHGGEALMEAAHGMASRRWRIPVTTRTRFDVASVTALFAAAAVL